MVVGREGVGEAAGSRSRDSAGRGEPVLDLGKGVGAGIDVETSSGPFSAMVGGR